ncbi:pectate lyase superfamily protein-domain-containing protein [Phaeosphaeriaceae sp. PMI808]|nr:pectate lyase superfamily protein-domain-containing protein [Phaeosphaeriaceae sp. PMI808]
MVNEANNIPVKIYEANSTAGTKDDVDSVPLGTRSARERIQDIRKRSLKEYIDSDILPKNFTSASITAATRIVEEALNRSAEYNKARWENISRNQYHLKPGTIVGRAGSVPNSSLKKRALPDFVITPEIKAAAALLTEFEASSMSLNNQTRTERNSTGRVFQNVKDYRVKGDSKTDDTAAIKKAIDVGKRCGKACNSSSTKNAIVYFPQGTYLVSSVIPVYFSTQLIGDATNWPTIIASSKFIRTAYVNTASFYRQIRNFKIDITQTRSAQQVACIHNQVGQAMSLQFLELIAKAGTKQRGITSENGSRGVLANITFKGGAYGLWGGSQQFTVQRMVFDGCATATWKSITIKNADIGFKLLPKDKAPSTTPTKPGVQENGNISSTIILNSSFSNVGTAVLISPLNSAPGAGSTGLVLENIAISGVQKAVADSSSNTILASTDKIEHPKREFSIGKATSYKKPARLLDANGAYFKRAKPQYEDKSAGDFISIKDYSTKGDSISDDSTAVQSALWAARGKILHVDAGTYILKRTVTIPSRSKIVGETWSQFAASGPFFGDANNPKVMLSVSDPGEEGDVEMQDLMFTTKGATPRAVLGSAGMWDCHARIRGAAGTSLNPEEYPPVTSGVNANCQGASLIMHITPKASGDADLVDPNSPITQTSVYVARSLLIESQSPTWMYGTASEHAVFYQYNFNKAKNIFTGMIQTESPYYQPTPKAPAPFEKAVGRFPGDPKYQCDGKDFDSCDSSWAVMIRESTDIIIGGAGLYSWFSTYTQDCIDKQTCQKALLWLKKNGPNIRVQHLITIGAKYSLVQDGRSIAAKDNLNSQITLFEASKNEIHWIDPKIWDMDEPTIWCEPPTSTLDYPLITTSGEEVLTIGDSAAVTAKARRDDPSKALIVKKGTPSPLVEPCSFYDPNCSPFGWDGQWTFSGMDEPSSEETLEDDGLIYPSPSVEQSSTPTPTPTVKPKPPTIEFNTSHSRIKDAANHLCGLIKARRRLGPGEIVKQTFSYNWDSSEFGAISVATSLEVKAGCEFVYSDAAYNKYMNVPIDSCNCAGKNGKQGGKVENNYYKFRLDPEKEA